MKNINYFLLIIFLLAGCKLQDKPIEIPPEKITIPVQKYAWEGKHPDIKKWESFARTSINDHFNKQLDLKLLDSDKMCPKYNSLSKELKIEFWIHLLSKLIQYESNYKPSALMAECRKDKCVYSGGCKFHPGYGFCMKGGHKLDNGIVISRGLTQMSLESSQSLGCPLKTPDELHEPSKNIDCFFRAAARYISRDSQIQGDGPGNWKGLARYWSPMRDTGKDSFKAIRAYTNSLPFCK